MRTFLKTVNLSKSLCKIRINKICNQTLPESPVHITDAPSTFFLSSPLLSYTGSCPPPPTPFSSSPVFLPFPFPDSPPPLPHPHTSLPLTPGSFDHLRRRLFVPLCAATAAHSLARQSGELQLKNECVMCTIVHAVLPF